MFKAFYIDDCGKVACLFTFSPSISYLITVFGNSIAFHDWNELIVNKSKKWDQKFWSFCCVFSSRHFMVKTNNWNQTDTRIAVWNILKKYHTIWLAILLLKKMSHDLFGLSFFAYVIEHHPQSFVVNN